MCVHDWVATDEAPATAGTNVINYRCRNCGLTAWREGCWGTHGTGVHGFRGTGLGHGSDGSRIPADQFD